MSDPELSPSITTPSVAYRLVNQRVTTMLAAATAAQAALTWGPFRPPERPVE
jgi:hypothetical protein